LAIVDNRHQITNHDFRVRMKGCQLSLQRMDVWRRRQDLWYEPSLLRDLRQRGKGRELFRDNVVHFLLSFFQFPPFLVFVLVLRLSLSFENGERRRER